MKKMSSLILALALAVGLATQVQASDFPEKDIQGIICWGAGGETDRFSRALTPLVEPHLGASIVLSNKTGGTGAIGMQYVYNSRPDGYTLLYAAENPQLYKVLKISKLDYEDLYPITIMSRAIPVIVANKETPWNTFEELVNDAKTRPGKIKMGTCGAGSLPHVISAMVKSVTGSEMLQIPFDGTGPGVTALLGGHIQVFPATVSGSIEHYRAGRLKILAVVSDKPVAGYEDLPLVTEKFPGFKTYLPWGSFFGVFCRKDVPDDIKQKLVDAYEKGSSDPTFKKFVENSGAIQMNIHGEEAYQFLRRWQSITSWLLDSVGAAKVSPAKLGIPKP